jgi:hypothetical protein
VPPAGCNVKAFAEALGHADGGAIVLRRLISYGPNRM